MSSSISASDDVTARAWRRWLVVLITTVVAGTLLLVTLLILIDPFSTGRFTPLTRVDITTFSRPFMNAGRVRDPRFDSAIYGTSASILLDPQRIGDGAGRHFALLSVEGARAVDHLFLMDRFDRLHRPHASVHVLVIDDYWCEPNNDAGVSRIPRWLYDGSFLDYAYRILSPEAVKAARNRAMILLGLGRDGQRPDGYVGNPWPEISERKRQMLAAARPTAGVNPTAPFPPFDELERQAAMLSPASVVLMVFAPVYSGLLPEPGSVADARLIACKARARAVAAGRPRTDVLDLRVDGPSVRNADNFTDFAHYNNVVARESEQSIAQKLRAMLAE